MKYEGNKYVKHFTCWNQLLVMMFGQLSNRDSLRDLTSIFDLKRLYHINEIEAYFVIRQRGNLQYEIINEGDTMHNADGVLSDQIIRLTNYFTKQRYPAVLRRVTYYAADKNKTFVYLTNNMEIPARQVAFLYKYRWRVELFFKWIKQHLKIKSFWGTTETAVTNIVGV